MEEKTKVDVEALKDSIFESKEKLAKAKSEFKKFKKAHGIRTEEKIKEPKLLAEFKEHQATIEALQTEVTEFEAQMPKGAGGAAGRTLYTYQQVVDPKTGEMRDPTKSEQKRWRAKARLIGKKEGIEGSQVPWDPNFLVKPEKKEKAPKAEKAAKEEAHKEGSGAAPDAAPRKKAKKQELD